MPDAFDRWMSALEARHLADLRFADVARALRALSSCYVERRDKVDAALEGTGKRAAFALFYAPIHFMAVWSILRQREPPARARRVVDLGCGTGAAGAAWAVQFPGVSVLGLDRHPWAVSEARWTYRTLGVQGQARQADVLTHRADERTAVAAAFTVNELPQGARARLLDRLLSGRAAAILVVEPLARRTAPWWNEWAAAFTALGGRDDMWRFALSRPEIVARLDAATGLDHREIGVRSLTLFR